MVKKIVKKKKTPTSSSAPKSTVDDSIEMPMARRDDADDVAEDYAVFDMSNIAAPVIEFEMPNLEERKIEKPEKIEPKVKIGKPKKVEKAVKEDSEDSGDSEDDHEEPEAPKPKKKDSGAKKSAKKAPESSSDDVIQLTAEKLNNELVQLRPWIQKAKSQLTVKIVRQKKELEEKKKKGKGGPAEEVEKKLKRMGEEIVGLKTIDRDTVAKFAALNTKNLDQLKINGTTPLSERLMYKVACHAVVVNRIKEIKQKYIEWNKTAAFFMQRLGQQYSNKAEKTKKTSAPESKKKDSEDVESGEDSEGVEEDSEGEEDANDESEEEVEDSEETPEDYDQSDVEMVDSDEEEVSEEAAKKRRNLLLGLIGAKEDTSRPALKPKKRKLVEDDLEDVGDSGAASSTASGAKKQKTKEAVKAEMKKVLEKELKTKETKNPKQQAKKVTKKTTATPLKKKIKTPTKTSKIDENMELSESEDVVDDLSQKTLVMKIDLSQGGKIAKAQKSKTTTKTAPKPAPKGSDDDDDESAGFFLPASGKPTSSKIVKTKKIQQKTSEVPSERVLTPSKTSVCKHKKTGGVEKKNAFQPQTSSSSISTANKKGTSKNTQSEGELHPSWIASQLKKKELAAAKPAGKRIQFSDDDD